MSKRFNGSNFFPPLPLSGVEGEKRRKKVENHIWVFHMTWFFFAAILLVLVWRVIDSWKIGVVNDINFNCRLILHNRLEQIEPLITSEKSSLFALITHHPNTLNFPPMFEWKMFAIEIVRVLILRLFSVNGDLTLIGAWPERKHCVEIFLWRRGWCRLKV